MIKSGSFKSFERLALSRAWVALWSPIQRCVHIERLSEFLAAEQEEILSGRDRSRYRLIGLGSEKETRDQAARFQQMRNNGEI